MTSAIEIIYEDNHLLGILKPAGLLAQGDRTGDPTALAMARAYIKATYDRPGNVFLGLVHRLDRPVSGVMVFARTSKAASRLTCAFRERVVEKTYLAVVDGAVAEQEGVLHAHIERTHARSRLSDPASARAREASLAYRVLARRPSPSPPVHPRARGSRTYTMLEIRPRTGRHHQIRLQLSSAGHPIIGDMKYRAPAPLPDKTIALHAATLRFPHPVRDTWVELTAPPALRAPWDLFSDLLARFESRRPS